MWGKTRNQKLNEKEASRFISQAELDELDINDYDIHNAEIEAEAEVELNKLRAHYLKSQGYFYRAPKKRVVFIAVIVVIVVTTLFIWLLETVPDYLRSLVSPY